MRPGLRNRLVTVVDDPTRLDDLDGVFGGGNRRPAEDSTGHSWALHYFSITWPPVTGMA